MWTFLLEHNVLAWMRTLAYALRILLLFFKPWYSVPRVDQKIKYKEKKLDGSSNPAGTQHKNCRAARQH